MLENYVLARGRKGIRSWSQPFLNGEDDTVDEMRQVVMEILQPFTRQSPVEKEDFRVCRSHLCAYGDAFDGDAV